MRAALVVHKVAEDVESNLQAMRHEAEQAAAEGADLVLFPEAALTGLVNNGDPAHDLPLGRSIPGPATEALAATTRELSIFLAAGLLERKGGRLYDSAVLLGPDGRLVLKYRRIQPQWHGRAADPQVYYEGPHVRVAHTWLGTLAFLICGDLFDDGIVARARCKRPDYLLLPFARSFADGSFDQAGWEREEEAAYAARAALTGCTVLMVNALEDPRLNRWPSFGGALVVSPQGAVLARHRLGSAGIVCADV